MEEERRLREERARKRIKDIKGFYSHLTVYVFVNIVLQLFYAGVFDNGSFTGYIPFWVRFTTPGFWGLSLLIHYIVVFHGNMFSRFYKKWEARKIQEYMDKEEKELDQRWN